MRKSAGLTKIKAIYQKEMLDLLRDKKTLIMMVVVPLLLYPLIMMASILFSSSIAAGMQSKEYRVALIEKNAGGGYDSDRLRELITDTEDELEYRLTVADIPSAECESALMEETVNAYVEVTKKDTGDGVKQVFTIYYLSSNTASSTAADMLSEKLKLYSRQVSEQMLTELGLAPQLLLDPVETAFQDKSANEERVGSILGMVLPMLMVTSILLGAFYPAVDTTAGEKERGTLETLLTLPVGNAELITGKFLAVSTVAVASAVLNLVSMVFMSLYLYLVVQSDEAQSLQVNLTDFIPALLIVLLCVVTFALFISAVTMCVTTFAKSFKEANNYATPLMLVVMFATFVAFVPDLEFTGLLAAVPVVNISLLISNILVFKYSFANIMIVLVTNIAYAALAILLLARLYDSEELMFGESGTGLQIFTGRKALKKGGVPTLSDAVLVLAVVMLLFLYAGSLVQARFRLWGLLITQFFIIGVPVLAAWYTKKDMKETFSLKVPGPVLILGAVLAEAGGYVLVILISNLFAGLFPQDIETVNESMEMILDGAGFVPALLVIGLAPAICEEALFRGYFLSASKKRLSPAAAVVIGAAVFGIYHLSLVKFFTTGFLGLLLCYVVYRTGSIVLSAIMHFLNNSIAVAAMFYPEQMERLLPGLFKDNFTVGEMAAFTLAGAVCLAAGIYLINRNARA